MFVKLVQKQITIILCFFLSLCVPFIDAASVTPYNNVSARYSATLYDDAVSSTTHYAKLSAAATTDVKAHFTRAMKSFTSSRGFPGFVISIYKNGQLIVNESHGVCDANEIYPIASLSKLFTEASIKSLIRQKVLSPETKVYDYLDLTYPVRDRRVKDITVQQLLEHRGGWDRDLTTDPLFQLEALFPTINPREIPPAAFLKFVLTNFKLDHRPGAVNAYCNFGYFLLGLVIEKATNQNYLDYVNATFANPSDIMLYQGSMPSGVSSHETFSLELSSASFGLAAKISDIGLFFSKYDRTGLEKTGGYKNKINWWKDGSLPEGITLMLRHRKNDVVVVAYIPDRNENSWGKDNMALKNLIDSVADRVGL